MGKRGSSAASGLRRRAEEGLAARKPKPSDRYAGDPVRLLHELEVRRIELEIQNEELRRTRAEVEDGLSRYEELFRFAPIAYVVLDGKGVIFEANLEASAVMGTPYPALPGRSFLDFFDREQLVLVDEFLDCVRGSPGSRQVLELALGRAEGAREVRLVGSTMAGPGARTLVAVDDVTARKCVEVLREEGARKDEFLATLSHELRNPLAPIRTSLSVLDRVPPDGEAARRARSVLHRQLDHLIHIVDDLLDATRVSRGKIQLVRAPLELRDLVRKATDDYGPSFDARGVSLASELDDQELWVDGDRTRLTQVVGNLLGNALKFTPPCGRVVVTLRREHGHAILRVQDSGIGIDPRMLRRLFVPFVQAPQGLDRARGGLGLGLATVKGLVELHGGTVTAASEGLGRGAQFTVCLPSIEAPSAFRAPRDSGVGRRRRRVLVIEHGIDAANLLRDLLQIEGHDVQTASDGPTGIGAARAFRPDVVLCDVGLPGMTGYEVARAMRADPELRGCFLVALTGYARPDDQKNAMEAGFDRHLARPFAEESIDQVLQAS